MRNGEEIILPKRTIDYLENGAAKGQRHNECKQAALQLRDSGKSKDEAEKLLCDRGEKDGLKRAEVVGIVSWAYSKSARSPIVVEKDGNDEIVKSKVSPPKTKPRSAMQHAKWWLSGVEMDEEQFRGKSQLAIPGNKVEALKLFLEMLYQGIDRLNVVGKYTVDKDGKANPYGAGKILSRDEWLEWIEKKGIPVSPAGVWFRPNPCRDGTGKGGSVTDSDIVCFQFVLLESDVLSLPVLMALYSRLKLPIAAAYSSGGHSIHALINLHARDYDEFSAMALRITAALKPFGIDQANKNPSRLSRFPGAWRTIGSSDPVGCEQKLLWLNPGARPLTEEGLEAFENSLTFPAVEEKPFRSIVLESIARYEELNSHPGLQGVPTGIDDFDNDTGGLQKGQMTVIAAESNGGKSSLALNMINAALNKGHGVALFTLEMGNDEIADILFALNCRVDRNNFNTGRFTNEEMLCMTGQMKRLASFRLWTFDESSPTAESIRTRILSLKAEGVIDLAVVDYVQLVTPATGEINREQQVARVARALCACAKDAKIPIVVLSQLNEEGKLRESRVIGHEAHNVLVIENQESENRMIMKVIKGRRIRKKNYELFYEPRFCMIRSMAKTVEAQMPYSDE